MSLLSNILAHVVSYRDFHQQAIIVGGCFAIVAVMLSFFLIWQHLRSYSNPEEQKWIVAVVFMVPFYAIESIISLWNPSLSLACDILRNCYEAFALYSFWSYLVACLGGERGVVELLEVESRKRLCKPFLEGRVEGEHLSRRSFFNFFMRPCIIGRDLFAIERFGLVQYMILKTLCAFLAFLLELLGVYGVGEFKWYYGYPYIAVVLNFSQMWALGCLVQFYHITHERLRAIKPLAKFISFKAIVFATWWQGVAIALLCALGVVPEEGKFQHALQDFLICIEMAIAAVAHMCVFSAQPYNFVSATERGMVTTIMAQASFAAAEDGVDDGPTILDETETRADSPGTSVGDSVQDIIVKGGQSVVRDVVLAVGQAMGPVEKGVTKMQETFHQRLVRSKGEESSENVRY